MSDTSQKPQGVLNRHAILEKSPTLLLVASMIPIALGTGPGSASRASMAKVIIGGQILCLLLTLLVTPVSYAIFDDWGRGIFWRRKSRGSEK